MGDAMQRLTPEPQRGAGVQISQALDFAGGMVPERQLHLILGNTRAVVGYPDEVDAAAADLDLNLRGAGVQRVLDQFLHHGGWPLHHLSGGDLGDNIRRKKAYRHSPPAYCGTLYHALTESRKTNYNQPNKAANW